MVVTPHREGEAAERRERPGRKATTKKLTLSQAPSLGFIGYEEGFFTNVDVMMDPRLSKGNRRSRTSEPQSKAESQKGAPGALGKLLASPAYDYFISSVILVNSVAIGLDQKFRLERNEQDVFKQLEKVFLLIYCLELGLHFYAGGLRCLESNWVRFDCALVCVSLGSFAVDNLSSSQQWNPAASLLVLRLGRLLRLARLLRTMRLVANFRELWMLAQGLMSSIGMAVHTLMFGLVIFYVIACAAIELIPLGMQEEPIHDSARALIEKNFRSLPVTLLTLVQFATFDNVVQVYKPLVEADYTLTFFFIPVMLVVGVVFMNLVTAVIINRGLEQSMQDKAMRKAMMKQSSKCLIAELLDACLRADANESGTISRKELEGVSLEGLAFLEGTLGVEDLAELFDSLDVDGRGEIGIQDFCRCIDAIVTSETHPVIKRMERMMESMRGQLGEIAAALHAQAGRPPPRGPHAARAAPGRQDAGRPSAAPARAGGPDGDPMPAWAEELVSEVRQSCAMDVRLVMEEVCSALMNRVLEGASPSPDALQGAKLVDGTNAERSHERRANGKCHPLCSANWEALPPDCGRCWASDRSRSETLACGQVQPATITCSQLTEHSDRHALRLTPLDPANEQDVQWDDTVPEFRLSDPPLSSTRGGSSGGAPFFSCWP